MMNSEQLKTIHDLSPEENVALSFRQSACWLAALATQETRSCGTDEDKDLGQALSVLPSLQVAQHLLNQQQHPAVIPSSLEAHLRKSANETLKFDTLFKYEKKKDSPEEIYHPCCKNCGGVLQAGHGGTTLRILAPVRRSRTQRRRAKQKEHRDAKHRSQDVQHARVWEYGALSESSQRLKGQCLQLTCGTCCLDTFVPTHIDKRLDHMKVESRLLQKKATPTEVKGARKDSSALVGKPKVPNNGEGLDFIRLPTAKRAPAPQAPLQSLDQAHRKKKKKKGNNNLMDFLSSLNN